MKRELLHKCDYYSYAFQKVSFSSFPVKWNSRKLESELFVKGKLFASMLFK